MTISRVMRTLDSVLNFCAISSSVSCIISSFGFCLSCCDVIILQFLHKVKAFFQKTCFFFARVHNVHMDNYSMLISCAAICGASGSNPPLPSTTAAVLRIVHACPMCTTSTICDIAGCSYDAVRAQLSRLCRAGMLTARKSKRMTRYEATMAGQLLISSWDRQAAAALKKLVRAREALLNSL